MTDPTGDTWTAAEPEATRAGSGTPGTSAEAAGAVDPVTPNRRNLTDPREIRALAHPVRVALLEALRREGTLTATEAGELLDESPANCSFHLRTLAKYGYVEEAPGGTGRQRPWRRVGEGLSFSWDNPEAEASAAAQELDRHFHDRELHDRQVWRDTWQGYPKPWRDASFSFRGITYLTAEELTALNNQVLAIVDQYNERVADPTLRPAGALPVSISAIGHPLPLSKRGN